MDSQFRSRSEIVSIVLSVFEGIEQALMKKSDRVLFGSSVIMVLLKKQKTIRIDD